MYKFLHQFQNVGLDMVKNTYKWLFFLYMWFNCFNLLSQENVLDSVPEFKKKYNIALKYIDSTKYKQAIVILKNALDDNSEYVDAYNKLAYCKIQLKDYKGAERELRKAESILPYNFETYKLNGINFYLTNKFKESKVALDSAIRIAKDEKIDDWELQYYRALLMYKGKSYKTAIDVLTSVIEINPTFIKAMVLKGEIIILTKEYKYAIKELTKAIEKMEDVNIVVEQEYTAYKLRAKAKFEIGDYAGAVHDWNTYIDQIPNEEEALISRAAAKIESKDNTGAISDLDAAIKINSKNPVSFCYRGVAKSENKAFQEALKDYEQAIKLKFDYADAYFNRAATKMAIKDKHGACDDLNKADGLGNENAGKIIDRFCK